VARDQQADIQANHVHFVQEKCQYERRA
jgi:hypothetical protein